MWKVELDRGGRDGLHFGADDGVLVAVLAEHLLDDDLGALELGGVVLALDGESDLLLLEAVEDVRDGDGVEAGVVDGADGGLLAHVDQKLDALGLVDTLDADVVEVAGVPERVEGLLDGGWIVDVAGLEIGAGEHRLLGDAAVADDLRGAEDLRRR